MPINLKNTLGTINFTDYIHVTACKVSSPSVVAWEDWIDVPVTNYNFVIPNLDPENYYVSFYDAPTNIALGTLVIRLIANGLTGEFLYERRFYTCGGSNDGDPIDGSNLITDPYLIGKNVTGIFKEAFRFFIPTTETTFDDVAGEIAVINGTTFSTGEVISVDIKYSAGTIGGAGNSSGLYTGSIDISAATETLLPSDRNKRVRCVGSAATQVITVPTLSSLSIGDGFYIDNSVGGVANQVKLLLQGGDRINYNGFMAASDEFSEFWVPKGEHLLIKKEDSAYYEIITDYKGVNVGERIAAGFKSHPMTITENGQLMDGDEWPRMWWWLNNVLPSSHKYVTDTVTGSFIPDIARLGMFALHSTLKKFRMPSTFGLTEKGLSDFENYSIDTVNRPIDYPGGVQAGQVGEFPASIPLPKGFSYTGSPNQLRLGNGASTPQTFNLDFTMNNGKENRVKNIGIIYCRRM